MSPLRARAREARLPMLARLAGHAGQEDFGMPYLKDSSVPGRPVASLNGAGLSVPAWDGEPGKHTSEATTRGALLGVGAETEKTGGLPTAAPTASENSAGNRESHSTSSTNRQSAVDARFARNRAGDHYFADRLPRPALGRGQAVLPWSATDSANGAPSLVTDPCPACGHLVHRVGPASDVQLAARDAGRRDFGLFVCDRGGQSTVRMARGGA